MWEHYLCDGKGIPNTTLPFVLDVAVDAEGGENNWSVLIESWVSCTGAVNEGGYPINQVFVSSSI